MRYLAPVGRALFAAIFVLGSPRHFRPQAAAYAAQRGAPLAPVAVPFTGALALLGGLSVALGLRARWGAGMIALFLVLITPIMHNFWAVEDPAEAEAQRANFMKNLAMLGAALLIAHHGAGPLSVDDALGKERPAEERAEAATEGQASGRLAA